jgi:hypothetical protein
MEGMESFDSLENINIAENLKEKLREISNLHDEIRKNIKISNELSYNQTKSLTDINDTKTENYHDEIDKLGIRLKEIKFETGLQYLKIINEKKPEWKKIKSKIIGTFKTEEWRSVFDDIEAYLEFTIESLPVFAQEKVEEKISASFQVVPSTFFKKDKQLWPGLEVSQESYSDDVYVSGNLYIGAVPVLIISDEEKKIAQEEMLELVKNLKLIKDFEK